MEQIKGVVSNINQTTTKTGKATYGLKVGENWYNFWGVPGVNEGEEVVIDYEVKDKFNNGKKLVKTGVKIKQETGTINKEMMYRLQWAIKVAATNLPRGTNINDLYAKAYEIVYKFESAIREAENGKESVNIQN